VASRRGPPHPISTALYETLDSVVAPTTRDALLRAALDEACEGELPTDPARFKSFVDGPLRSALTRGLGNELGETITEELGRMLELIDSSRRPETSVRASSRSSQMRAVSSPRRSQRSVTPPSQRATTRPPPPPVPPRRSKSPRPATLHSMARGSPTPPPYSGSIPPLSGPISRKSEEAQTPVFPSAEYPSNTAHAIGVIGAVSSPPSSKPASRSVPFVVIATRDSNLMRKLTAWLDPRAAVLRARNIMGLLHDLEDTSHARSVIVIDCKNPSINPTAMAALADELPATVQVVLWGATPELESALRAISEKTADWLYCGADLRAKEIAARCVELVS
jgi:hypothetical protein